MLAGLELRTFCFPAWCLKRVRIGIYKIPVLPVVVYGCETLRGEHRWRVSENRMRRGGDRRMERKMRNFMKKY
jgi:hypothetical protein